MQISTRVGVVQTIRISFQFQFDCIHRSKNDSAYRQGDNLKSELPPGSAAASSSQRSAAPLAALVAPSIMLETSRGQRGCDKAMEGVMGWSLYRAQFTAWLIFATHVSRSENGPRQRMPYLSIAYHPSFCS